MGVQIRNSSLEPVALPHPLQGILRGRQAVLLSMTYSSLTASFPSVTNGALEITDLGDSWSGANDDASYGPATSVVVQQAAQTALTPTVPGDMPGPTPTEITTRLNLIENRLNEVSAVLRNLGFIAT